MSMPSKAQILDYWKDERDLYEKMGFLVDWGEPTCWACGKFWNGEYDVNDTKATWAQCRRAWQAAPLQRCHIVARALDGSDSPSNLVLLCAECHDLAPDTVYPDMFFRWMRSQCYGTRDLAKFKQSLQDLGADIDNADLMKKIVSAMSSKDFWDWCDPKIGLHGNQLPPYGVGFSRSTIVAALLMYCEHENNTDPK